MISTGLGFFYLETLSTEVEILALKESKEAPGIAKKKDQSLCLRKV